MQERTRTRLMATWRILVAIGMLSFALATGMFGYLFYRHEIMDSSNQVWTAQSEYSDRMVIAPPSTQAQAITA